MNRRAQVGWLVAAVACSGVALFGAQGCTITTGDFGDGGIDFDTGTGADTGTTTPNACYGCLFDQCSGQWASCQGDAACAAIYKCSTRPACAADPECVQQCYAAQPAGQKIYYSLAFCDLAATCTTCGTTCSAIRNEAACVSPPKPDAGPDAEPPPVDAGADSGAEPDPTVPPAELACNVCTQQSCGTEKAACGAGTDCDQYQGCVTYCSGRPDADIPGCLDDCEVGFAEGKAAADALGKCNTDKCGVICGYRSN